MSSTAESWELSQSLSSIDGLGVRCAAVLPPIKSPSASSSNMELEQGDTWYRIVTGNQGGSIVEYSIPSGSIQVLDKNQHNHAVTAILSSSFISNDDETTGNNCIYITACKDGMVRIFHGITHELIIQWQAHEKPVTSLSFGDSNERYIVTGSWDGTAKVWDIHPIRNFDTKPSSTTGRDIPKLITTLPDHENSVCVASMHLIGSSSISDDVLQIVTGSAGMAQGNMIRDHSVRLWSVHVNTGKANLLYNVSNDHEGPIRDILATKYSSSSPILATCSNDGTIRVRDPSTGNTLSTLVFSYEEHPPMLLSITYVDASSQNDDNIEGELKDDITGTMVAAAESGHVVFWNHATINIGQPQIIRHADCVWNVLSLPNGDVASCCQDGMVRIFTRLAQRMADVTERQQFTDSVNMAVQALQNGPTSDEVAKLHPWHLSYEKRGTSEGQVHLFNKNNVAIAAQWSMDSQTWIEVGQVTGPAGPASGGKNTIDGVSYDHVLPIEIEQTNGQVSTLQIGYNNGENPYTAGQRFIDQHMLPQSYLSQIAEYITQRVGKQPTVLGMASSNTSTPLAGGAFTGTPISHYEYIPGKGYKSFDLVDKTAATIFDKMKTKIQEFDGHDNDMTNISTLMTTLQSRNRYHASKVTDIELSSLSNLLTTFTAAQSFPALDLARLTVLHPDASTKERSKYWFSLIQSAIVLCQTDAAVLIDDSSDGGGPAVMAVPMLTLRLFSNALKGGPGSRSAVVEQLNEVLNCATIHATSTNKNIRLSVTTLIYNICLYLQQNNMMNLDILVPSVVGLIAEVLNSKVPFESEALLRTMIAMGTFALASPIAKDALNANYLASKVEPLASSHGDVAKAVAKEVYSVLS
jgi:phospholipase A-2-activating protein